PVGNKGTTLFLRLDKDAPNRRIVAVDLTRPEPPAWKTIVPEKREAIESAALIGDRLVVQYLVDVQSRILLFGLDGQPQDEVGLPGPGTVGQIRGRQDASQIWYGFSSVLTPSTVYRFEPSTHTSERFEAPPSVFDATAYETRALFATSSDGTRVPFF